MLRFYNDFKKYSKWPPSAIKHASHLGASPSKSRLFLFALFTLCGVANFKTLIIFPLSKIVHLLFFRKIVFEDLISIMQWDKIICWHCLNWLLQSSTLYKIVILLFCKLFQSSCFHIFFILINIMILKQIIVLLLTKLHRILLNSGKSVETLRPKQKRKMKEFWKKENGHLRDFLLLHIT